MSNNTSNSGSSSSEAYLKQNGVQWFLTDIIRHLAATVLAPANNVAGAAATSSSSSGVDGGTVGASSPGATVPFATTPATPNAAQPPFSPTSPCSAGSAGGIPLTSGATGGGSSGGVAAQSSGGGGAFQGVPNYDDVLSEMAQYFQDIYTGNHIAVSGCPFEYVLCTQRSRLTLALLAGRCVSHVLPAVLADVVSDRVRASKSFVVPNNQTMPLIDGGSLVVESSDGDASSAEISTASGTGIVNTLTLLYSLLTVHCADMPKPLVDQAIRRAALAASPAHRRMFASGGSTTSGCPHLDAPLTSHGLVQRSFILHLCCKELVEDLQVAFPVGGSGAAPEKCRTDMWTWRRAFERWGLEGSWRCGPSRPTVTTASYAVEPYPPLSVLQDVFSLLPFGASNLLLDADMLCTLLMHSDVWFLWCTAEQQYDGIMSSAFLS